MQYRSVTTKTVSANTVLRPRGTPQARREFWLLSAWKMQHASPAPRQAGTVVKVKWPTELSRLNQRASANAKMTGSSWSVVWGSAWSPGDEQAGPAGMSLPRRVVILPIPPVKTLKPPGKEGLDQPCIVSWGPGSGHQPQTQPRILELKIPSL